MEISNEIRAYFIEAYKSAAMHADLDWEITLAGNGVNPCEAVSVYRDILQDFGIPIPAYTQEEREELILDHGEDPDDY